MKICEKLSSTRPIGKVTCGIFHGADILPRKERLKKQGYYALPDYFWDKISKKNTKRILVDSYCFHLEDHEKLLDEEDISQFIDGFVTSSLMNRCFIQTANQVMSV